METEESLKVLVFKESSVLEKLSHMVYFKLTLIATKLPHFTYCIHLFKCS